MINLDKNVCTFIPNHTYYGDLHILHLVYETKPQSSDGWKTLLFFRMHYVTEGTGILHTQTGKYELSAGDVFFCFPSTPYSLQSVDNFKFIYIGYLGEKARSTADKFNLCDKNCVFKGLTELSELWLGGINVSANLSDLYAEGLFLCTVAKIASRCEELKTEKNKTTQTAEIIKKYIDDNFTDPSLSLESMCRVLSYNGKYISSLFKKSFNISFKEYLNTVRINNACSLMSKGFSSIKEIAFLCGFNDPLYFSKVFKSITEQSPSEYVLDLKRQIKE